MAYELELDCVSLPASGDLSVSQYCFVNVNSSGQVALSAAAANAEGVLQDKPSAAGAIALIGISGITKCVASAAITAGDNVASAANGQARTATTSDFILGTALETAATGQIFSVLLNKGGKL